MNRYVVVIMSQLLLCHSVFADYVIFSQYDGINKWENVYVPVDSAIDWVKPGVGYHPIQYGHDSPAQSQRSWVRPSKMRAYLASGGSGNFSHDTFTKASESSTFFDRRKTEIFMSGTTTPAFTFDFIVTDPKESMFNAGAYQEVIIEEVSSQVERDANYESTISARAIVTVETHEDLERIVKDYFIR